MRIRSVIGSLIALVAVAPSWGETPLSTAFTYQGQLKESGVPLDGSANIVFKLFDASIAGNLLGTQTVNGVPVTNGLFTVELNADGQFGANAFTGDARWLDVSVNGSALTPRQALAPTPYALHALNAPVWASNWSDNGDNVYLPTGNVGIGADEPTAMLHFRRPFADTGLRFQTVRFQEGPPASLMRSAGLAAANGAGQVWNSPDAARLSDDVRATANFSAAAGTPDSDQSQLLDITSFGFTIPPQAAIVGITVNVEGLGNCGCSDCDLCKINGSSELLGGGEPSSQFPLTFNPTESTRTTGGTFEKWNIEWTPSQVNADLFGVRLFANLALLETFICLPGLGCSYTPCDCTGTGDANIDAVSVSVFFYDTSVTSTPVDWTLGLSEEDANFRIAATPNLSTPVMVVTSQGSVGIGTTEFLNGFFKLAVNGPAAKPGGGQWSALSDASLKRSVEPLTGALGRVLSLRGVTFEFTEEGLRTGLALPGRHIGLIAQDVEQVFPEWVGESSEGYKFITEAGTTALMVEALRELRAETDQKMAELRAEKDAQLAAKDVELAALKERLTRLEAALSQHLNDRQENR